MPTNIQAVLLDLGEVLIRLDFSKVMELFKKPHGASLTECFQTFDAWEAYDQFERGLVSEGEFFDKTPGLREIWNSILKETIPEIDLLLSKIPSHIRLFALSNTNETHLDYARKQFPFLSRFEKIFASHEIGFRKPEPEIFHFVENVIQIPQVHLLFIDDRIENVLGARTKGWKAEHCKESPRDLITTLQNYKVFTK